MGDVAGPAVAVGGGQRLHQMPAGKIGAADVADFSTADQHVEGAEDFFDRSERVETVQLEQIDVIGFEAAQAAFHRVDQVKTRGAHVVRIVAGFEGGFGGDDDFVAAPGDRSAQHFFRIAAGINVGGVEHVQPGFQANVD